MGAASAVASQEAERQDSLVARKPLKQLCPSGLTAGVIVEGIQVVRTQAAVSRSASATAHSAEQVWPDANSRALR
ncbi:hypothetical protein D3C71_2120250 [compost metagenome]